MIPKVIHYCWFGKGKKSDLAIKCINSWSKKCKDYEIIEWNEENFDVNINDYVSEAYKAKKYAFVSDYARFYILYKYGGIYLDVDVEVFYSLDDFLEYKLFLGFENNEYVNPGLIIGSEKLATFIKQLLDEYEKDHFLNKDGTFNYRTVVERTTDLLIVKGLEKSGRTQLVENIQVFAADYFCPMDYNNRKINITNNTYTIHHYAATWFSKSQKIKNHIKILWKRVCK